MAKVQAGVIPAGFVMGGIGALALAANAFCFVLLWRHQAADINLKSTWLCSRNDVVANGAVVVAAALVVQLRSAWPDVSIGGGIAVLWESRRRVSSPVFWQKVEQLEKTSFTGRWRARRTALAQRAAGRHSVSPRGAQ